MSKSNGQSSPDAACNCGTNARVPISTNEFCEVKYGVTGTKLAKIKCTPSTAGNPGSPSPTGGCLCGSDDVAVAGYKYCGVKADGTGLEMPVVTCPAAKTNGQSSPTAACN